MTKLKQGLNETAPNDCYITQSNLESLMENLPYINKNTQWGDLTWSLKSSTSLVVLDFSQLALLSQRSPRWASHLSFCPVFYAKTLLVLATKNFNNVHTIRDYFFWIAKSIFYLARQGIDHVARENLIDFIGFQLGNDFNKEPTKRIRLLSYKKFTLSPSIALLAEVSSVTGLPLLFDRSITDLMYWQECKEAVELYSEGGLTFGDWKAGGNLDYLTLDYGQYYIEHCIQMFEKHYPMAIALRSVLDSHNELFKKADLNLKQETTKKHIPYIVKAINGLSITPDKSRFNQSKWDTIVHLAQNSYDYRYRDQQAQRELLCGQELKRSSDALKIDLLSSPDAEDWFRQMVGLILQFSSDSTFDIDIRTKAQNIIGCRLDLEKLRQYLLLRHQELITSYKVDRPTTTYLSSIGIDAKSNIGVGVQYYQFLNLIESCGFTAFMAINGWRGSEYGFALSDIDIVENRDLLDQWHNPIRFSVRWLAPKVHGENKIDREITFNSYLLCTRLSRLLGASHHSPCLYSTISTKMDLSNSSSNANLSAAYAWEHFVEHYERFKEIDQKQWTEYLRLCQLKNDNQRGISLSGHDKNQMEELLKRERSGDWDCCIQQPHLLSAYQRARDEAQRIRFKKYRSKTKGKLILEFAKNRLEGQWHDMFVQYLSENTVSFLRNLPKTEQITRSIINAVVNEILTGCAYPTPHALRHMWAEAVFRRFDGDVGWMIRSQFKHISQSMWLAYVRDKQRNDITTVKRQVVSDLLTNYVRKAGTGYAGGMDRRLRLMMRKTVISSLDQMTARITEYGLQHVKEIKTSPYGFCLLQQRNQVKAKCAIDDEPQRQNAAPEVCFGCQFNFSMASNLPNILLSIANHRNILKTSVMPPTYRLSALNTVKNALAQVRKLGAPTDIITGIEDDLKIGKKLCVNDLKGISL